nr:uncharacterized protein LOC109742475 isoform X1 [Aegilops tauschii subsp. strangulata]
MFIRCINELRLFLVCLICYTEIDLLLLVHVRYMLAGSAASLLVLTWRGRSFPYYEDLFALYDGRYAQGRSCHGMDYYANKATQLSQFPTSHSPQLQGPEAHLHTPTPTIHAPGDSSMQFEIEEDSENTNWFSSNNTFSQVEANPTQGNDLTLHAPSQVETIPISSQRVGQTLHEIPQVVHRNPRPSSSAPVVTSRKRAKKQKTTSIDDFHERYLKLRREEINRFAAIEERKLKDPFSIKKCIKALEKLEGLSMADMLKAADIFTANKENREVFLSFSSNELRLGWLTGKVRNS